MANLGFKGVDIRQSGLLVFRASLKDAAGVRVTSGAASLYLYELQSDGTLKSYDFGDNTFKATALTTETAAMTHRAGNNATTNTGVWTFALGTLSGFTVGSVYLAVVSHATASPTQQEREFQYGSADGDATAAGGKIAANTLQWFGADVPVPDVAGVPTVDVSFSGGTPVLPQVNPSVDVVSVNGTTITGANIPADVQTIKGQAVTCEAGVTVLASVGTAATSTAQTGDSYAIVNHASYGNAKLVRSTTPGNTLDVSTGGEAGIDWANVGSPATPVGLSGTTVGTVTTTVTATTVTGLAANVITASSVAADAVTEIQSGLATAANQTEIKTQTDQLTFTVPNKLDATVAGYAANQDPATILYASSPFTGWTLVRIFKTLLAHAAGRNVKAANGSTSQFFDVDDPNGSPRIDSTNTTTGRTPTVKP